MLLLKLLHYNDIFYVFQAFTLKTAILDCECFVHTTTPTVIKNTPHGVFFITGGDEGIRTLDTVARIPHFQCGALDQLCDVSLSVDYSSSDTSSTASSADSIGISSDDNDASNSASISRNNGSSLPTSNDSSPNSTTGASL